MEEMMTKVKWIMAAILVAGVLSMAIVRSTASNHHQERQHRQQTSTSLPPLLADGSTNPSAVPDLVAYEILLNSVADGAGSDGIGSSEAERSRAGILAKKTKLSTDKIELLKATANTFKANIRNLDTQAMELKDRHWPRPNQSVFNELSALQRQKEGVPSVGRRDIASS
jgi:hypothetical protein